LSDHTSIDHVLSPGHSYTNRAVLALRERRGRFFVVGFGTLVVVECVLRCAHSTGFVPVRGDVGAARRKSQWPVDDVCSTEAACVVRAECVEAISEVASLFLAAISVAMIGVGIEGMPAG